MLCSLRMVNLLTSRGVQDQSDRRRESFPVCLFALQVFFPGIRKGIIFGTPVILGLAPLGGDPALLLQAVERGVKRTLIDLQLLFGDLADALRDGPAVHGLESDSLEDQQIECALDEIGGFAHDLPISY